MDKPMIKDAKLYRSVQVASLGTGRRGKHHDLMGGIMRELKMLKAMQPFLDPLLAHPARCFRVLLPLPCGWILSGLRARR